MNEPEHGSPGFLPANWPAPAGIIAGTTLRTGGASAAPFDSFNLGAHVGDSADRVVENRRNLRQALSLPEEPTWLRQVHGTTVVELPASPGEQDADASWTRSPGVVCVVMTADCLPVLICDRSGTAVGAVHAGWRGLCDGVVENTVDAMPANACDLLAWLGPAISQPLFEVGAEVRERFIEAGDEAQSAFQVNAAGRWQADLYALARQRLNRAGVSSVYGGGRCTFSESPQFFSYRRDGRCGRMASVICMS